MSNSVEAVIASYKGNTYQRYVETFNVKKNKLLGLNPEHRMKEPVSDLPMIPALGKLTAIEHILMYPTPEMKVLIDHFGLASVLILSSDVVFKKDNEVFHRHGALRDTVDTSEKALDDEALDFYMSAYTHAAFSTEWLASFGVSYVPKNATDRKRVITDPISITAEIPKLTPKQVRKNIISTSPTGVDLVRHAIKHNIPLIAQSEGSDKKHVISAGLAEQIIIYKALAGKRMVKQVKKARGGEVMSHYFDQLDVNVAFQHAFMGNILEQWVASVA